MVTQIYLFFPNFTITTISYTPPPRWSSAKNRQWVLTYLLNRDQRLEYIHDLGHTFAAELESDMESMLDLRDSGWRFRLFQLFDIRFVVANPTNMLRYGVSPKRKLEYNPLLKPLFHRQIYDPSSYLRSGYGRNNFCILGSILLNCHSKVGSPIGKLTISQMEKEISSLNTQGLFRLDQKGIAFCDMEKLERLNSPIPESLIQHFPSLRFFKGIAINIFRIRKTGNTFRIFPTSLSCHNRDKDFFQSDLLELTQDILASPSPSNEDQSHVLAVPYLAKLVTKFTNARSNWQKFSNICRTCQSTFSTVPALTRHHLTCPLDGRRSSFLPRKKSLNQFHHKPFVVNHFSGKVETNALKWKAKDAIKTILPLNLVFAG